MASKLTVIRELWQKLIPQAGFNAFMRSMVITDASDKTIKTELTVTEDMCNIFGLLHGGATTTIADVVSSLGVLCSTGDKSGVSVNLSVNFLKGAKAGEEIIVQSDTVKIGKTLAFLDIKVSNKKTGDLIATVSHVKHIADR